MSWRSDDGVRVHVWHGTRMCVRVCGRSVGAALTVCAAVRAERDVDYGDGIHGPELQQRQHATLETGKLLLRFQGRLGGMRPFSLSDQLNLRTQYIPFCFASR